MSIPKEPRQLMINIMYLVLTALLALNVSAEVMNAFFTLDDGNKASMATVDSQLNQTVDGINKLLEDESKAKYKPIQPAIEAVRSQVAEFNSYVNAMRDNLIDVSGNGNGEVDDGDYTESYGKRVPKGKKNKDITTRLLVDEGQGEELKDKILETRTALIKIYTDLLNTHGEANFDRSKKEVDELIASIATNMPFNIDDETWQAPGSDKKSWSDFKFRQMPVAAVLPLLSQIQSNLKSSEAGMINSMAELTGGKKIEFDAFFPVVQADRSYVVGGEKISAKISVGTYSTSLQPENVKIFVGSNQLQVGEDGTAEYSITGSGVGQKKVPLRVEVTNPLTGKTTEGESEFVYEVGSRSVAVAATKMNVFYIGVDNPIAISASGVSSNDVRVSASGGGISIKGSGSNRMVTVSQPGAAKVNVSAGGKSLGSFDFRVKRIPDPVARLSNKSDGAMGTGEFKAQGGVGAFLDNFDFEATCQVAGFNLVRVPKRQDAIANQNRGARYDDKSRRLVSAASPGDVYYFENVRAKCPGDNATRKINGMVFKIQ